MGVFEAAIMAHPRSLQKSIGPSEIGIECDRRILFKLAGVEEPPRPPAWKPAIGTAVHAQLEEWFEQANFNPVTGELEYTQWVTEQELTVGYVGATPVTGHSDLFHVPTGTVCDHKIIGDKQLQHYRAAGPSPVYRVQAHLYGLGFFNHGGWGVPREVMIAFLPRNQELSKAYLWHEPWNAHIAMDALARLNRLDQLWRLVGIDKAAEISPGCDDAFCPWCRAESFTRKRAEAIESGVSLFNL